MAENTFTPTFSPHHLPDISNCSRSCRLYSHICTKEGNFWVDCELRWLTNLEHFKDGNLPLRKNSSKEEFIFSNTTFPSTMISWTRNVEVWLKDNFNEKSMSLTVNYSVMALAWLTQMWEQLQVQQNFSFERKFHMCTTKFLHPPSEIHKERRM